jgi:hypothetical protein
MNLILFFVKGVDSIECLCLQEVNTRNAAKHAVPLLPFFFLQCRNLGTLEDISVAYIDGDGDEVILLAYIFIILTWCILYNGCLSVRYL